MIDAISNREMKSSGRIKNAAALLFRPHYFGILLVVLLASPATAQIAPATTVQLPTFGVSIDADGVLDVKEFRDETGRLLAKRLEAAKGKLGDDVFAKSKMRKISLVKLERAVREKIAAGDSPDDVMRHLAGLQRIQYAFFFPDRRDIVIAGPAEGWIDDLSGRPRGVHTGRPVLLLEDLIVALRAYAPGTRDRLFIGCTIDPDRDGLARLREFQRTIPRSVRQHQRDAVAKYITEGTRKALGQAHIRVFGVSEKTHFAQVLIEADYRMKRIGIGLETPPTKMATFIGVLKKPNEQSLQRWWFTPNYECLKVTKDRLAMEMVGEGVQLLGEDKLIGEDGSLAAGRATPSKANELYTTSFTNKFPEIAARSPVFAQLRNMIDLVVATAFIRKADWYSRADWSLGVFGDEELLPVETLPNPRNVECAVNTLWKGNRLLSPAGGGVSIRPDQALATDQLISDTGGDLAGTYKDTESKLGHERWWWD